jgi:hypothetical protein
MRGTWTPDVPAGPAIVEVGAPDLRDAELRRRRHLCRPHVQARLGAVERTARHEPHRVLHNTSILDGLLTSVCTSV